jgi:hypothetical protein
MVAGELVHEAIQGANPIAQTGVDIGAGEESRGSGPFLFVLNPE